MLHENNNFQIKGLNLRLDKDIHAICETAHKTSASARSIMYVLVIAMMLTGITLLNTKKMNWSIERMNKISKDYCSLLLVKNSNAKDSDSISALIKEYESQLSGQVSNHIMNIQGVHIPLINTRFDVNDLGNVSGFTFLILLTMLWFVFKREYSNLSIAFNSITHRYPADADEEEFKGYIEKKSEKYNVNNTKISSSQQQSREKILAEINLIRRRHHYNYLSMSEIYTLPPLDVTHNSTSLQKWESLTKRTADFFLLWMYFLPLCIFSLVIYNDVRTFRAGEEVEKIHALIVMRISSALGIGILILTVLCTNKKYQIMKVFRTFQSNNYTYKGMYGDSLFSHIYKNPWTLIKFIGMILGMLGLAYILTNCWIN